MLPVLLVFGMKLAQLEVASNFLSLLTKYKQILSTQDDVIRTEIYHIHPLIFPQIFVHCILMGPPSQDRCKSPSCTTPRELTMYIT